MKKLIFVITFALSFAFNINAQQSVTKREIKGLSQRVDSLEHQLSYLDLYCKLNDLRTDLAIFANELSAKSTAIKLDMYNHLFDRQMLSLYQAYYDSCLVTKESCRRQMDSLISLYAVKVFSVPLTVEEQNVLSSCIKVINYAYDNVEKALDVYKVTIDGYRLFM